jgi:putative ATP-grasp target RiPP
MVPTNTTGQNRVILSAAELFPLGRNVVEGVPAPRAGGRVPFGVRFAVPIAPVEVDLSQVSYDPVRQVGVVHDGGTLVPLLEHTAYSTSTNTANRDAGPGDVDSDAEED